MASATNPELMKQSVAFATSGEVPNGRITMMIYQASSASGKADELYKMVAPHEAEFAAKMPADGLGPTVLVAAAAGSSNPELAKTLLAAKSSQASIGAKIWAARVADSINTAADFRARAEPVVAAWLKAHHA
jgi:aminopeptidase N